ncbi:MAG: ABC transporter permease [Eubacteriales bacterium]|nr:ABC transporter permease [Eubacteriales bacterium]
MLFKVLRKDLKRRKGVNIILFLFILLATVFLSSSLNNILTVSKGIDYFLDYANIPEITLLTDKTSEDEGLGEFLEDQQEVNDYEYARLVAVPEEGLKVEKNGKRSDYESGGITNYLGSNTGKYCKVFGRDNKEVELKNGEIVLDVRSMEKNDLVPGDKLIVDIDGTEQEFTIKSEVKDAAFGTDMGGMGRILLNGQDFEKYSRAGGDNIFGVYLIHTNNENELTKTISTRGFTSIVTKIDRSMYKLLYVMDIVLAALLILAGICFILIAFLVLRFTLVFTMEENYSEIGIMQAIGLRNFTIRRIYLVKYLLLTAAGAGIGLALSFPVSRAMIGGVSKNIILADSSAYLWANMAGALLVAAVVILFCYRCTKKINKISVIEAIRGGQNGERYHKRKGIKLFSRSRMSIPVYLGLNDILSHLKRYVVLIITFCISFVLISIPLNTVNTMNSREMISKFSLDPDSSVYMTSFTGGGNQSLMTVAEVDERAQQLKKDLKEKGYEAELTVPHLINLFYYKQEGDKIAVSTTQIRGDSGYLTYSEGTAPLLENEIAVSKNILKTTGWELGDTVHAVIGGRERDFIITGTYSDYMQIGSSIRMNPVIDIQGERIFAAWSVMVNMDTTLTQEEMKKELQKELPQYTWGTAMEILEGNIGSIRSVLKEVLAPMTALLCDVIALISIMMEQLFIVREKGEIAMMKSMGFSNRVIRGWQVIRMVWVVVISMLAAIPLSVLSNRFLLTPIFGIMGAEITIQVDIVEAYVIYPGILLIAIILAAAAASGRVKRIRIQELNNLE